MKKILLIVVGLLLCGCMGTPDKMIYRETQANYTDLIYKDWKAWAPLMVGNLDHPNGQKDMLPTLTEAQYKNRLKVIEDSENFLAKDRSNDTAK